MAPSVVMVAAVVVAHTGSGNESIIGQFIKMRYSSNYLYGGCGTICDDGGGCGISSGGSHREWK